MLNQGQKKNESHERSTSLAVYDALHEKRISVHEAIRACWKCETHSIRQRPVPCWCDGHTTQCYAITKNDLSLWANLHDITWKFCCIMPSDYYDNQLKNPTTVSIDEKPPQINLYNSTCNSQGSQQQQPQVMPPLGFPPMMGYPNAFMNPWMIGGLPQATMASMGQAGQGSIGSIACMF